MYLGDWGIDKSGDFIRSSILTTESPSLFQIENRSDVLLGNSIQLSKETACRELEMMHFNGSRISTLEEMLMNSRDDVDENFPSYWKNIIAKRMVYLLYHDFLASKMASKILQNKSNKDCLLINMSETPYALQYCEGDNYASPFSLLTYFPIVRMLTVFAIWVLCIAMGLYVLYFAYTQTTARQMAWAKSFALWLAMDAFVISSLDVWVTNIYIPLLIKKDVATAKELVSSLMRSYASQSVGRPGNADTDRATSLLTQRRSILGKTRIARIEKSGNQEKTLGEFNAADFFFISFRLAKYFSDFPIAKAIISYRTCDPPGHTYTVNKPASLSAWVHWLRPLNYYLSKLPAQSNLDDQSNDYARSPQYSDTLHLPYFWSEFKNPLWVIHYGVLNIFGFFLDCGIYVRNTALHIVLILIICTLAELHIYIFNHYELFYLAAPTVLLLVVCFVLYCFLWLTKLLIFVIPRFVTAVAAITSRMPSLRPRSHPVTPVQEHNLNKEFVKMNGNEFDSNEVVDFDELPESKMDIEDHSLVFLPRQSYSSNRNFSSVPEVDLTVEDVISSPEDDNNILPFEKGIPTVFDSREDDSSHLRKITGPLRKSGDDADHSTQKKLSKRNSSIKKRDFGSKK